MTSAPRTRASLESREVGLVWSCVLRCLAPSFLAVLLCTPSQAVSAAEAKEKNCDWVAQLKLPVRSCCAQKGMGLGCELRKEASSNATPTLAHALPSERLLLHRMAQEFPSFGGTFEFTEPALPRLLPWGVQKWNELGDQSRTPDESGDVTAGVFTGVGVAGFALGALLMLSLGRRKRATGPTKRSPSSAVEICSS